MTSKYIFCWNKSCFVGEHMVRVYCCSDAVQQNERPAPGTKFGMGFVLLFFYVSYVLTLCH